MNKDRYGPGRPGKPGWYRGPIEYKDLDDYLRKDGLSKVMPLVPGGGCLIRTVEKYGNDLYRYAIFLGMSAVQHEMLVQGPDGHVWSVNYYDITGLPYERPPHDDNRSDDGLYKY